MKNICIKQHKMWAIRKKRCFTEQNYRGIIELYDHQCLKYVAFPLWSSKLQSTFCFLNNLGPTVSDLLPKSAANHTSAKNSHQTRLLVSPCYKQCILKKSKSSRTNQKASHFLLFKQRAQRIKMVGFMI